MSEVDMVSWKRHVASAAAVVATLMPDHAYSKTYRLQDVPKEHRAQFCKELTGYIAEMHSYSFYLAAVKRKAKGQMTKEDKRLLTFSEELEEGYRALNCESYR